MERGLAFSWSSLLQDPAGLCAGDAKLKQLSYAHSHAVLYLCGSASSGSGPQRLSAIGPYETQYLLDIIAKKKATRKMSNGIEGRGDSVCPDAEGQRSALAVRIQQ